MGNEIIIRAVGLTKEVPSPAGPLTILDDISFAMRRSESLAVVGVSGSGKSTLLGLLAGLDSPTRGRVVFDGVDLGELDEDGRAEFRRQRVGFVFQSFHLLPSLTAIENVMLPMELSGHRSAADSARTALDRVGLVHRLRHYPNQLSGGEQQRVAIARAFAAGAKVLFADEPTGNLDSRASEEILGFLRRSVDDFGQTIVMVTHDPSAASYADRVIFLVDGRIVDDIAHPTLSVVLDRIQEFDQPHVDA